MRLLLKLWNDSRALSATAAIMLAAFVFALVGLMVDGRTITGAPAWLKPAKFAISTAIFTASIAWLFRYLPNFPTVRRWSGPGLAAILLVENAIIFLQAARGTTSHFNIGTRLDAALFGVMGVSIGLLWLLSAWIAIALFQETFEDAAWGWALRLGMAISVLGSGSGAFMVTPTATQRAAMARGEVTVSGAHTVGAPDGGAGLPGVNWSKEHGDLRVPHFLGMHALQIIPFLAWLRRRRRSTGLVFALAGSYFSLYVILLWQALRGESIAEPSAVTGVVLGLWLAASVGAVIAGERGGYRVEALP